MGGRIRTIKPEWLEDERLASLSDAARLLSVALILLADDHGRGRASIPHIIGSVWNHEIFRNNGINSRETLAKVREALASLSEARFVSLYEVGGQAYFEIRNWSKHQRVDKPGKPRVPLPSEAKSAESSREHREVPANSSEILATVSRPIVGSSDRRIVGTSDRIDGATEPRADAREAPPPPPPVGRAGSVRDRPAQAAEHAYAEVVKAAGGLYVPRPSEDVVHFRAVGEAAQDEARRTRSTLTEVLATWATRWRQSRRTAVCRPAYWAEWVQSEQSRGANRPVEPDGSASWIDDVPDESIFPE